MSSKKRKLPDWMNVCKTKTCDDGEQSYATNEAVKTAKGGKSCTGKEERRAEASAAFDKVMEQSLPEIVFEGNLTYCSNKQESNLMCELIEFSFCDSLSEKSTGNAEVFMGFDMEWPVTYQPGKQDPTALVQLCTGTDCCYLFHLSTIGCIPKQLKDLLENHNIKKVGIGIESDLWKLEKDFGIQVLPIIKNGIVDLSKYANKVLNNSENWSLDGLTRQLFKSKINKDPKVRKSNWAWYPLSEKQKEYAATDAFVCYKIYEKLKSMEK